MTSGLTPLSFPTVFLMEKDSCQPYKVTYLHKQDFIEPVFSLRKNTQLKV